MPPSKHTMHSQSLLSGAVSRAPRSASVRRLARFRHRRCHVGTVNASYSREDDNAVKTGRGIWRAKEATHHDGAAISRPRQLCTTIALAWIQGLIETCTTTTQRAQCSAASSQWPAQSRSASARPAAPLRVNGDCQLRLVELGRSGPGQWRAVANPATHNLRAQNKQLAPHKSVASVGTRVSQSRL